MVKPKKGVRVYIPKAVSDNRLVAGQLPNGWHAARYGIPEDIMARLTASPSGHSSPQGVGVHIVMSANTALEIGSPIRDIYSPSLPLQHEFTYTPPITHY